MQNAVVIPHAEEKKATPVELVLRVAVRDRAGVLFDGVAEALSSYNTKGPFDVLPLHTNFISLISRSVTLHLGERLKKEIPVASGVLVVRENNVEVYLGVLR